MPVGIIGFTLPLCPGRTTGIVVSFNLEGEEELRENEELSEAFRFLDSVRPSG